MPANDLHEFRLEARSTVYPNRAAEDAAVAAADEYSFDRVRNFERSLKLTAEGHIARQEDVVADATAVTTELRDELCFPLASGTLDADQPTIERYQKALSKATSTVARLREAAKQAEFHAARCDDPYGTYNQTLRAYPALRNR